jgi:hypothetical protein
MQAQIPRSRKEKWEGQRETVRAMKEEWEGGREVFRVEIEALKQNNKKLEYIMHDLLKLGC